MSENQMEGAARNVGGKIESAVGNLTGDTKHQAQGKVDQVAGQAQQAYGKAKDAASDAADQASSKLNDVASKVSDHASNLGEQVYAKGEEVAETVVDYIRNEPVAVMLGVAAIGMVIGYLIGRPPSESAIELGRFRAAYRDR